MMNNKSLVLPFSILTLFLFLFLSFSLNVEALSEDDSGLGPLVKRKNRRPLIVTENGEISAVKISDGTRGPFHLQFITLEPNSLFLPVLLHADMVFYVHTGSGKLSWAAEEEIRRVNLRKGDIYRLQAGSVLFVQSNLEPEREKLRLHAIFSNTDEDIYEPAIGAYSSISDLVLGFDRKVLQAAFKVPEDVIEAIRNATKPQAIVHAMPGKKTSFWELEARFLKAFLGGRGGSLHPINKKKKTKAYNILEADPDFKNCNGWSLTVTREDLQLLRGSNIGVFMVNLTKGSMMGPHWNPMATEIGIVLHGQGMVRVVCSSSANESECKNMRFKVKEGDVFAVPRFHPMAQMSFNNDSFVFMGFSTTTKRNYPQFLIGKTSVLQALNKQVLAVSFNVTNTTIDQLLAAQTDSIILDCTSCAEEEERIMKEEIEKEREEEEARKREEEKKREEEEARKREEEKKREEEEKRKREEEEARKREEEEEEQRKREEEEARKREEEEEEQRKREEEEARKREEEEARKREEEEARRREEEEAKKREEERKREEEEARKKEEEEEARKKEEEEKRREEEEKKRREEEAEEEARQEEERKQRERQQEEEKQREQEEREQEEAGRTEEERERRKRQQKEEERKQQEQEERRREEAAKREQEEAKRQEEERQRRPRQEEEEARKKREGQEEAGRQPEEQKREGGGEGGQEGRRVLKGELKV